MHRLEQDHQERLPQCNDHQSHQKRQNQRTPRLSPHRQNQRPRNLHERHRLLILLRAGRLKMAIEIFAINNGRHQRNRPCLIPV